MGTIYHVSGVWPPPFCVDCLIFCMRFPVSHALDSQHFVFELFFLLQAQGRSEWIYGKHQYFFILCLEEDLGFQSLYVAQPHYLCWSTKIRILVSLLFLISCHTLWNFNIYCDITNTQVWPIATLKWSGILKICLFPSTSASFQYHYYYYFWTGCTPRFVLSTPLAVWYDQGQRSH